MAKDKLFIIIPAYNEGKRIEQVVREIKNQGFGNVVVVDDGSSDNTEDMARKSGAVVVKHIINRGPGAATQTGFEYAKQRNAGIVVTIDADGQHNPKDIMALIKEVEERKYDIVFGSRMLNKTNKIPVLRKIFNKIANLVTFILSFYWVSDSQTGMKALNYKALDKIKVKTSGFEFCTEIWMQVRQYNLKFKEIPIEVFYTRATIEKGQNFATGISTIGKLFLEALSRTQ